VCIWRCENNAVGQSAVEIVVTNLVATSLSRKGLGITDVAEDLSTAVRELDVRLPSDVASLVRVAESEMAGGSLGGASSHKARKILNPVLLKASGEHDDVVFECKEFCERNRGAYEEVVADLACLGSQLSRLGEMRVGASQGKDNKVNEEKKMAKGPW